MSGESFDTSNLLNRQGMDVLQNLLKELKTAPAIPQDWTKTANPQDWNLNQIAEAKRDVVARYGGVFSPGNLGQLDRDTFLGFLKFENNHHWYGLERPGRPLVRDMPRLRAALLLLVDESQPLKDRLDQLRPISGPKFLSGLGKAILTPILQVVYPERYGVLNKVTAKGMKTLNLWPSSFSGKSFAETYEAVNRQLLAIAKELETDLWTLDFLWWKHLRRGRADLASNKLALPGGDALPSTSSSPAVEGPAIVLPSALSFSFEEAYSRLLRFCREEYDYYDRIPDLSPHRIEPVDVLATVAMNSFVNDANKVRLVHRGLAGRCDSILPRIPVDADLLRFDPDLRVFRDLIHAAVQAPRVLVPVATKILHRKRRGFIPMLDSVVIGHYLHALGRPDLEEKRQLKSSAASVAVEVLRAFREDLKLSKVHIDALYALLADDGFDLTPVRILEILVWTEKEPNGYYRAKPEKSTSFSSRKELNIHTIGTIQTELIYSRPEGKNSASGIVPPEGFKALESERSRLGVKTIWWYDADPHTGERRPAFTPIQGGRMALIDGRDIRHGDRFVATFEVKDVTRQNKRRKEMWLVDAQPVGRQGSTPNMG